MKSPRIQHRWGGRALAALAVSILTTAVFGAASAAPSVPPGPGPVDPARSTIGTNAQAVIAGNSTTITIRLRDSAGRISHQETPPPELCTTYPSAFIGPVTFVGQGVWQASFTATQVGNAKIIGSVFVQVVTATATLTDACGIGTPIGPPGYQANIHIDAGPASGTETTISTNKSDVPADGVKSAKITVQAKDVYGNARQGKGDTVLLSTTVGSLTDVVAEGNGRYSAKLSSTGPGLAEVSGTINGQPITTGDAMVTFS